MVTVMESRCLTASIFFHRFFVGPFLGLPGPCPMAKLNDKSKVWRGGMVQGPEGGARTSGVPRNDFPRSSPQLWCSPLPTKKNGWNSQNWWFVDVEMFFFLGFLFGAFFFHRFHDSFLGSVSLIHSEFWSETSHQSFRGSTYQVSHTKVLPNSL